MIKQCIIILRLWDLGLAATSGDSHNNNMQSVLVVVQQIKRAKLHVSAFLNDWNNEKYQPSRN